MSEAGRAQLPLVPGSVTGSVTCSANSPASSPVTQQAAGPARLRPPRPGWLSRLAGAARQCVMVMLTCPTFVIHLCDNWDRCFHVHPQCVHNQGQRLVNRVTDKRRATSSDRSTVDQWLWSSFTNTATAASASCDNNHQVGILPAVVTSNNQDGESPSDME